MKIKTFNPAHFKTTQWEGGSTTELFIWPQNAQFSERKFDFRLSLATVERAASEFTPLLGIHRQLMVLKGAQDLTHQDQHSKDLKPLDVDQFEGGWTTSAKGTAVNFNVMTMGEVQSHLYGMELPAHQLKNIQPTLAATCMALYVAEGKVQLRANGIEYMLEQGVLAIAQAPSITNITIIPDLPSELAITEIKLKQVSV